MGAPQTALRLFACEIFICIAIGLSLMAKLPQPHNLFFGQFNSRYPLLFNITIPKNANGEKYRKKIQTAFLSYWSRCKGSDYLRPLSRQCTNSSSQSITLIESLDALYLAGLEDEYQTARKFAIENTKPELSEWISVHELGTRIIGGFLSIYGLSGDQAFLSKAVDFANNLIDAFGTSIPYPVLDGIHHKGRKLPFTSGNILSESSGFIVEFSALSRLTGDKRYQQYVDKYLSCIISKLDTKQFQSLWSLNHCGPTGDHFGLSSLISSFLGNVLRLSIIDHSPLTERASKIVLQYLQDGEIRHKIGNQDGQQNLFDSTICQVIDVLNSIGETDTSNKFMEVCKQMLGPRMLPVNDGSYRHWSFSVHDSGFNFDSWYLQYAHSTGVSKLDFEDILNVTDCKAAQCALSRQNPAKDEYIQQDFMPSEAISKWLKFLYLMDADLPKGKFVINEAGHFIPLAKL